MGSHEGCPYRGGVDWLGGEGRTGDLGNLCTTLRPLCGGRGAGGGPSWRGWEPPPQSLRDSSPSGGAFGSDCSRVAGGGDVRGMGSHKGCPYTESGVR